MKACGKVNFVKNFFSHTNSLNLFQCTGWNGAYPDLYKAVQNIGAKDWNHVFGPFGREFFDNRVRRDRIFRHVKQLDAVNGLDDLGRVMTALNETNFYDSLSILFECAENINSKKCKDRKPNTMTKSQIKDLFKFLIIDSDLYGHSANVVKNATAAIGDEAEPLRIEVLKFYKNKDFVKLRLSLVTRLLNSVFRGIGEDERKFMAKIFFTITKEDGKPWLHKWFTNGKLTEERFNRLFKYPVSTNPSFIKDSLALNNAFEKDLVCESSEGDQYVKIDVREHLLTFLEKLSRSNFEEFQKYALQNTATLISARPFCPILGDFKSRISFYEGDRVVSEEYSLDFVNLISSLGDFLGEETNFELIKILTTASRGENPSKILYVLEFLSGETFQSFNELNKVILRESEGFYPLVLKIIKNINDNIYSQVGAIALTLMEDENESQFKALASIWNFWTQEERNFLFKFIDRHLDDETNYVALFNFYSKMLNELPGVIDSISKEVAGSDEALDKTYESIRTIVTQLSGKRVLSDFKGFFSRDQILRTIQVISRGALINGPGLANFEVDYVDDYVRAARKTPFEYDWISTGVPTGNIVECIKKLSNPDETFYSLVRNLPRKCKEVKKHEITIRMFSWLDAIDKDYHSKRSRGEESKGLFDEVGIMSPAMLGTNIGILKTIQDNFSEDGKGFKYFTGVLRKYLFDLKLELNGEKGLLKGIEKSLGQLSRYFYKFRDDGRFHRSYIIKEFAVKKEWENKNKLFKSFSKVLKDYDSWIENKKDVQATTIKDEVQPKEYQCENYQNLNIGNNACPDRGEVKTRVKTLLELLARNNQKNYPTGIGQLVRSAIPDQGLRVPFDRDEQTLKRMTLKETMEMMYKLTDKSLDINKKQVPFYPEGVRPNKVEPEDYLQVMTTMERIEVTIREVRFDMNYLGAHYHNSVARSIDYNKTVAGKGKLFKTCMKLRFCGKFFSRDQYRMGINSIEAYYGLYDANAYEDFGYGDYMKGLLSIVVGSSSKISAKDTVVRTKVGRKEISIPFLQTKRQLKKHNGVILTELGMLSAFSNGGRVTRDRVGRTPEELKEFLEDKSFNLVNEKILEGFTAKGGEESAIRLLNNLVKTKTKDGNLVHEDIIDFMADLSYGEQRFVERTISDMMVVFSYVGVPSWIPKNKDLTPDYKRYVRSNYFNISNYLDEIVKLYPVLIETFPKREDGSKITGMDLLKGIASPLKFLRTGLESEAKSEYYFIVNEMFLGLNKFLFSQDSQSKLSGIQMILEFISEKDEMEDFQGNIRSFYSVLYQMHQPKQKGSFKELADKLSLFSESKKINFEAFRQYLNHTTREENCFQEDGRSEQCTTNTHYDEFAKLSSYVLEKNEHGKTNLRRGLIKILVDETEDIISLIEEFTPYLSLQD
ncbi:MAG: hypothetical protein KC493_03265 [Bacteriovoracaceae bacterium]|nr:hypothetical protein [Bacteriovoracaceae bacterium]